MKYFYLLILSIIVCVPCPLLGQKNMVYTVSFNKSDFSFEKKGEMTQIKSINANSVLWGDSLSPALPYVGVNILIPETRGYEDFIIEENSEELILSNVEIEPNPINVPTNQKQISNSRSIKYLQPSYPLVRIEHTGTHIMDGYKYLSFVVCPFRYDAFRKNLFFSKQIRIKIKTKHLQSTQYQSSRLEKPYLGLNMYDHIKKNIINVDEIKEYYPKIERNRMQALASVQNPYKYIIVTNESLRNIFEKLAHWKTIKGVKTKVITVEECYDEYPYDTHQMAIKRVLSNYYSDGMEYALLAGDTDIVPAQICYLPAWTSDTSDTPADLYYSCLDNNPSWDADGDGIYAEISDNIDLDPEFIITRISVSTSTEAEIIVNRIIEYESSPETSDCGNKLLICGNKLAYYTTKNGLQISDAQYEGEDVYENSIQPYWSGTKFELFDTYTDHPMGANYVANASHFQTELEKGYTFVDEYSHGWANLWGNLEDGSNYSLSESNILTNNGYTLITSISCYSNAFDKISTDFQNEVNYYTTCLSESFLRNPNSGILGYFGNSREGWTLTSYYFNKQFYLDLLSSNEKQFGRATMMAKHNLLSYVSSQSYNHYRWIMMELNPLGDAELPIFTNTPLSFNNVNVTLANGNLDVTTGVSDCKICISSAADYGETYYQLYTGTNVVHVNNIPVDCYLCITKPGYIPFLARVGQSVYLQDEIIIRNLSIFSNITNIGSNVTTTMPQGPVTIESGKLTNKSQDNILIKNDFEVKIGAELEIQ